MFKSYTVGQAIESLVACKELLSKIYNKGNEPFDKEETNVLNQSISTLFVLMNDTDLELHTTPVFGALVKGQCMLHTQKIKNDMGYFDNPDHKKDLLEAIAYIDETVNLLKTDMEK